MNNKKQEFISAQKKLKKSVSLFTVSLVFAVGCFMAVFFYYTSSKNLELENEQIKNSYVELQKEIVKARVNQAYEFIQSIKNTAEEDLKARLKERVYKAYETAENIYQKYHAKEGEASVKQRIKDALERLRYEDNKSYIWITSHDNMAVTYPNSKEKEGKYIGDEFDGVVKKQTQIAKTRGEGFLTDRYRKIGEDPKKSFAQLTFVKDFGKYGWYFGSAVFLDEYTKKVQNEALEAVAKLRFEDNYIFVDTFDGYALIMNGKKLDEPLYSWELKDKNGVKILQEQLKAAMSSVEGGYSSYIWHEAAFDKDIEYISFSRALKEWNWKIGTGIYVGKINEEIENRRKAFAQKRFNDLWISIAFVLLFVSIASIGAFLISKRMDSVFSDMNSELETNG